MAVPNFNQFHVAFEVFGAALKQSLLQLQGRVLFLGMVFAVAEHIFCPHKPHVLCRLSRHLRPGNLQMLLYCFPILFPRECLSHGLGWVLLSAMPEFGRI